MDVYRNIAYRCLTKDYNNIPFQVRGTGNVNITPASKDPKLKRNFFELYWGIEGEGTFVIDGEIHRLCPDEVCFYTQGDFHDMKAASPSFHYRWLTFDGPLSSAIWKGLSLSKCPRLVGPCPDDLFCRLEHELWDYSYAGLLQASSTAFNILMLAASPYKPVSHISNYAERAKQIIDTNFHNPAFTVSVLAEELRVNRSQLTRKFCADYGISPVKYLINCRIQCGVQMITTTDRMVKDIATASGFADPNYFLRCIRQYTGFTVKQLRLAPQT